MIVSTRETHPSPRVGLLQVCAAGVLWGTGGLVVTVLHERDGLGAMTVSAWRMTLAAVALIGFAVFTRRSGVVAWTMRTHPVLVGMVGCGTALYQGLYFVSVLLVGVGIATVVSLGLAPILAAVWEHLAARTRPSWREVWVLGGALFGLVLISLTAGHGSAAPGEQPMLGLVLAVAAGATYSATTVLGHSLAQRVDPVALTTCATTVGALVLIPFLAIAAATSQPVLTSDPTSLALLVYLGVGTMSLSYGLLYAGLRTTSGSAATVATLVEPLSAALLAALILGERLTWPRWSPCAQLGRTRRRPEMEPRRTPMPRTRHGVPLVAAVRMVGSRRNGTSCPASGAGRHRPRAPLQSGIREGSA